MAEVERIEFVLLKKMLQLKEVHGNVKGVELFKEKYGQKGIDDCFNYMVACATPQNYDRAAAAGNEGGHVITPTLHGG
jgi:hypothetical protein